MDSCGFNRSVRDSMSDYKPNLVIFPYRILYLEGVQLSYIKVYEIIFHLWHGNKSCFISNPEFCRRTGLADSTIREAITFFITHNEIKRVFKGRKRYLLQPILAVEVENTEAVDNSAANSSNSGHPAEIAASTRCQVGGLPAAKSAHNITNLNITNLSKSFCNKDEQKKDRQKQNQKKHAWAEKPKSPLADVSNQSTSWKAEEHKNLLKRSPTTVKTAMMSLPKSLRPKKYLDETDKLPSRTEVQPDIPPKRHAGAQGASIDAKGYQSEPSTIRSPYGLLEAGSAYTHFEKIRMADSEGTYEVRTASG